MPSKLPLNEPLSAAPLVEQIIGLLAKPPHVDGIELDTAELATGDESDTRSPVQRVLLPKAYHWRAASTDGTPRVPLQLCEYLAYKAALAYEPGERIEAYLDRCCSGMTRIKLFDSARDKSNKVGVLADAQGYGFVFERKAFVIFRGTASGNDWKINSTDTLTSDLGKPTDRRNQRLRGAYGGLLDKLGDPDPGRHVGFSIAWAALKDEVEDWLAGALERGEIDKIVYSGHSLGGAIAQVAAFDHARIEVGLERDRGIVPDHIGAVVTFGAPAVGGPSFAKCYKKLLGDRTVLLESSGDLVPRIMSRWYYRMLYPLRQRVTAGVQAHLVTSDGFGKVAKPWTFASEPPLSDREIEHALSGIRDAAEKALKALAEQQKNREKEEADKAAAKSTAPPENADKPMVTTNGAGKPNVKPDLPKTEPVPPWVYWAVIGVVVVVGAGIAWYFVRRKLFSHDIEQRYALYLSTLSYQQLRAKHGGNLDLANQDLDDHLRFVRGDLKSSQDIALAIPAVDGKHTHFFESVRNLPVPMKIRQDPAFVEYLKRNETFV